MSIDIGASRLRLLAKWHAGQPALVAELRQLAAAWEADRAALESETKRADAAELAHETDCGQLRAALSARDHAVDLAGINAEAANELERRAERAEAALADKQRVCDGLVAAIENNQEIDEEHCRELDAARAALERARALEAKWRTLAAQSPTLFVHLGPAADELAAALGSGGAA